MYTQRSRRIKTDRRDAEALAQACRLGAYCLAHRLSERQRQIQAMRAIRSGTSDRWLTPVVLRIHSHKRNQQCQL